MAQVSGSTPATITLTSGGLQMAVIGGPIELGSFALNGVDAQRNSIGVNGLGLDITDATGSGAGWNVSVQATDFIRSGGGSIPVANVGPNTGFRWNNPNLASITVDSPGTTTGVSANPAQIDMASNRVFLHALAGSGIGKFHYRITSSTPFQLMIPYNALAGSYTSTVTFTIGSGPSSF
ncbi:WxL domain-containing protein [bacterium]|nr:WxL domain-containing protein [bacterium]